jgi:diaminohydroxyphosphoribosylaminopyrimidine deaminase/5-amino-6-(5-phosphoribosylamino)uracil reductase
VIVHQHRIIGEGYHRYLGGPHAEVEAIQSVRDKSLLPESCMYVNLEPCSHYGRTPPCSLLILKHHIPRVVIGCQDPNPEVSGKGIEMMRAGGVEVQLVDDPAPFIDFNRPFFVNQLLRRSYVTLKWAQSADGFIAAGSEGAYSPVAITGAPVRTLVHKLRARHHAIMVGRHTARIDNPRLNTRHYYGQDPIRIVFDRELTLSQELNLFTDRRPTVVLNAHRTANRGPLHYFRPTQWEDLHALMAELYRKLNIASVLVEGGTHLLQQFIDQELYDELYVFQGPDTIGEAGLTAPVLPPHFTFDERRFIAEDLLWHKSRPLPRAHVRQS